MSAPVSLLALDLDDTLLRADLTFSRHTKSVLKRAEDAGLTLVLASGRAPAAMERYARELGMHKKPGYMVANNGTSIHKTDTGEVVYDRSVPVDPALVVYDLASAEGLPVQIYDGDTIYVSCRNEYADQDQKLTGLRQVYVENFRSMLAKGQRKMVIPGDPLLLRPFERILKNTVGELVTIFTSKPYFLEVLPPNSGKGEALAEVSRLLGIPRSRIMAVGDSMNDESMLRWAGWGVAMRNSDERVKDLASFTSEFDNEEEGVAELVQRYILDGEPLPVPPRGLDDAENGGCL